MKSKGLLFGGALMAAGLATQSAEADFTFSYSYVDAYAYNYCDGGSESDYFADSGTWSVVADAGEFCVAAGTSIGSATAIMARVDISYSVFANLGFSRAYSEVLSYFTVTYSTTADVSWQLDEEWAGGSVYLFNITDGVIMVDESASAGATAVSLEAGKEYLAHANLSAFLDEGKAFVDIIIPAPGSLPLLAAGGLLTVSRRRRRE